MSGTRWADLGYLAICAGVVIATIAGAAWLADREATRGRPKR